MPLRRFYPFLVLFPILLLLWQLDYAPFWNPDEGRYAAASREMAFGLNGQAPDWLVPHLNTITRLNKPPLVYWLVGGSFRLFGPSEWSGRLVPALAAITVLIVLFLWGRSVFGLRAGLAAALVWATTTIPFALARTLNTDMLLTAAITLALWGIWGRTKNSANSTLIAGIGLGLALLAKGPVGVVIPLGIFAIYAVLVRKSEKHSVKPVLVALSVACLIGLPWYLAVQNQRPDFLHTFLFSENLGRFSGGKDYHQKTPLWYYLPVVLGGLLPWTGFFVGTFTRWANTDDEKRARLFLWLWAGLIIGFFSLSSTKLMSYVLPAFPALALLMGSALASYNQWPKRARGFALGATVLVQTVVVVALVALPGVLLDDKIMRSADAEPFAWSIVAVLSAGTIGLLITSARGRGNGVVLAQGLTAGALYLVVLPLAGKIAQYEDGSAIFLAIKPLVKPNDLIVSYKAFTPSGIFYANRPVTQFGFSNTSGLPAQEVAASPYFLKVSPHALAPFLHSPERVFWLVRGEAPEAWKDDLIYWGRNNDFFLYSNRPKPADFKLDFVAPRKLVPTTGNKRKQKKLKDQLSP